MYRQALKTLLVILLLGAGAPLFAHCDAMQGPVVTEAREALETGELMPVLKWIAPQDEASIREAFAKARAARDEGPDAKEVANLYFFQEVVRLHRKSEGEPFTGLKPGDGGAGPAVKTV